MNAAEDVGHARAGATGGRVAGETWIAAGLLALGIALRVREALRTPFWFDELFSLESARRPWDGMMRLVAGDIHPPLWTWMVAVWRAMVGEGTFALKLLPLAIGAATLVVTWRFARRALDPATGLLALALLAVHPRHVYFSQELRSYGLLALAVTLSAWAAWSWRERPSRGAALGWVLAATLTLYTHYLGGIVLALIGLAVLVAVRGEARRVRDWLVLQLGVAAAFAPMLPLFATQMRRSENHWMLPPTPHDLLELARRIAFSSTWASVLVTLVVLIAVTRSPHRRAAGYALLVALGSILLAYGLTLMGVHLFAPRYMFFTVPMWCMVLAAGVAGFGPRRLRAGIALVMLVVAARATWVIPPFAEAVQQRDAARLLEREMRPGDRLFCADTHSLEVLAWHMGGRRGQLVMGDRALPYFVGSDLVPDSLRIGLDVVRASAAAGERWWGVRTREAHRAGDRPAALFDSLARGGKREGGVVTLWAGQPGMMPAGR